MYPEHGPTNGFISPLGVPIVCRWELERGRTSWRILANVEPCLYLLHALLLPQHVALLIFSWIFPWHLKPFFATPFCEKQVMHLLFK